ncbi:hypothetical protein KNN17_21810 [Arthrobacter bambusae]|uniref:hypothetical protein n=1 Tax=Arthrobacter TaxID=1663 RepID=UPI001F5066C4|nr:MULTISPECIES: hypothetical protein [Arthrobacter]MCI0144187.1 hypothetical protein [Arthrobacter bambusae]UYY82756.1 hypothetical protein OIT41_06815 [Arthrobacter sp. YA7-1]
MSARDEISKAAESAMDLARSSEPNDDGHVPHPGRPGEPIKGNSSVSEATNATAAAREAAGAGGSSVDAPSSGLREGNSQTSAESLDSTDAGRSPGAEGASAEAARSRVPGPAGLPEPDPQDGTSEALESDEDPSVGMGRG